MSTTTTTTYRVDGMTCGHCAMAVTHEIGALAGVTDVEVDLPTGVVTVCSHRELSHQEIHDAVEEAGYRLAS